MSHTALILRVAFRYLEAEQAPGAKRETKDLVTPINKPKGISKDVVKGQASTEPLREDAVKPDKRDITPKEVFSPKPRNMAVLNFVREGWPGTADGYKDMDKAIRTQIRKDKGYDTVKNLSQYLVESGGGGGTKPVGK